MRLSVILTQVITSEVKKLRLEFLNVRNTTSDIFQPISMEDAVMQSDPFGSTPKLAYSPCNLVFSENP